MTNRFLVAFLISAGIVGAAHAQDANNLLTDGYFTNGSGSSDSDWTQQGPLSDSITTSYGSNSTGAGDLGVYGNFLAFSTNDGFAGSSGPGLGTSLFNSTPGQDLTISFDIRVTEGSVLIGVLQGSAIDGIVVTDPLGPYTHYSFTTTDGASAFLFENNGSGGLSMDLANVDIVPTPSGSPEPFTMGIGVAGICFAVRRRMKAKSAIQVS